MGERRPKGQEREFIERTDMFSSGLVLFVQACGLARKREPGLSSRPHTLPQVADERLSSL
jgi:hypothetical protein